MHKARKFLIVDDNADSRFLLVKTLLRKFPQATVEETQHGDSALARTKTGDLDALIVHRAAEVDGLTLIKELRASGAQLPIIMVSGINREKEAAEAGATTFLSYDAWLRIGTVVNEVLHSSPAAKSQ